MNPVAGNVLLRNNQKRFGFIAPHCGTILRFNQVTVLRKIVHWPF